jgi:hypothetical protein
MGQDKQDSTRGSLHQIVDDALDAFISVLDQHTLEDMVGASQSAAARESGGRSGKPSLRGATARTRRGPQQSAPRTLG